MHIKNNLAAIILLLITASSVHARINILEPWYTGQDTSAGKANTYDAQTVLKTGNYFIEMPFLFSYAATSQLEVGGSWGIKSVSGNTGINDMNLGIKYLLLDGRAEKPAVIGEASLSLPTGDHTKGLGAGGTEMRLHWALQKDIEEITGYFGIGLGMNSENSDKVKPGDVFYYHIGASTAYDKSTRIHGELKGFNHNHTKINGTSMQDSYQELYLAPGVNYIWEKSRTVSASLLIGLTSKSSTLGLIISCQ